MQKLTTRQALAAVLAIWDAWQGTAPGDGAEVDVLLDLGASLARIDMASDGDLTDAGRALLAEAYGWHEGEIEA